MATPIYALPSDELAATVTPVLVEGTEDPLFPLSNLTDGVLSTVFKPDSTDAFEVQWDFGEEVQICSVALFNIAIEAGTLVKVHVTNTAYFGIPSANRTFDLVIAAAHEDGQRDNPVVVDIPGQRQHVRLHVPAQASSPAAIGEIKITLGPQRQLTRSFGLEGVSELPTRPGHTARSAVGGKTSYDYGVTIDAYDVLRYHMDDAEKAAFKSLMRATLFGVTPFLFIFDPLVNHAWYAQFAAPPIIRKDPASIYPEELWETSFLLDVVSGGVPPAQG